MPDVQEKIEVLYALVDRGGNYSKVAGTSICSLLENTRAGVRLHLFHDGSITSQNRERFASMVSRYGKEIIFCNVREQLPEIWQEAERIFSKAVHDKRFTEATLYRLLAPVLLPPDVRRLIYLDADTIVNMDIRLLWQEPIGSGGLAAVREADLLRHYGYVATENARPIDIVSRRMRDRGVDLSTYFNAGVLLFDLEKLRSKGNLLLDGFKVLAAYPEESEFYDQSILNYYFAANLTPLPWRYNILNDWDKKYGSPRLEEGIYHYLGNHLGLDEGNPRDLLYFKYFFKTPWCDEVFLCRFFTSFSELLKGYYVPRSLQQQCLLRQLAAVLSRKSLVLAAVKELQPAVRDLMKNPGWTSSASKSTGQEEGEMDNVRFCDLGSSRHLELNLAYDVGSHLYLLFLEDYGRVREILLSAGLEEGEDFLDGMPLLESASHMELEIRPQIIFEKM